MNGMKMSEKILMCGHTGSSNRGCEAILRSTNKILKKIEIDDISALTFDLEYDRFLKVDNELNMMGYPYRSFFERGLAVINRKIFKNPLWGPLHIYNKALKNIGKDTMCLNIGGDTYCYGEPMLSYALNDILMKKNIDNVFWGCSIDETALKSKTMQTDLNKYKYIICRESLTEDILKKVIVDKKKIYRACDPAFQLEIKETSLPNNFLINNTVGINLSPLVFAEFNNDNDMMRQNVRELINWILNETEMNICLVPHVYNIAKNLQDIEVLNIIYNEFKDTGRISIIDKELSCCELKYIISKCRFFVGARTHSTIAAYSTEVPTIALSYSIKSRGIAKDLFGTDKSFAIPWENLKRSDELKVAFISRLYNGESEIRKHYADMMPAYKDSIILVAREMFSKNSD